MTNPISFTCSLKALDIEAVGVIGTGFALGQQRHHNILFKKLALGFIDELTHRVKDEPRPDFVIDFTDATSQEILEAIKASMFLGINFANNREAYKFVEGLGESLQQAFLARTKPGETLPASMTAPGRTLN